ncbi:hypothetical protein [Streptomyces mirabilis]|uniref:hypothetical protein n=1 Tax=Streptomyces mirabilis TaxID=68239 RepID=UPI0033CE1C93
MSTTTAALIVFALLAFALVAAYWQIRRACDYESDRDRIVREAHEQAHTAAEVDDLELTYSLPAYDPAWAAGVERLWDAVRDEQNKEDK